VPPERNRTHLALAALAKSVLVSMVAPLIVYHLAHGAMPGARLMPLALSGLPPALWLAWTWWKSRAIDILGLFAAENVIVAMGAVIVAHSEREALIGRSLQNLVLAVLFLATLTVGRPMMLHMARQLTTGNDPARRAEFDARATRPDALATYRTMTWVWTVALLVKAAGAWLLAVEFTTAQYLVASPLWDLVSDGSLVAWSMAYGREQLQPAPSLS
jgi:hypothetical protein